MCPIRDRCFTWFDCRPWREHLDRGRHIVLQSVHKVVFSDTDLNISLLSRTINESMINEKNLKLKCIVYM